MNRGFFRWCVLAAAALLLQACATVTSPDARDPWESMNRSIFNFNENADHYVIKPFATAYHDIVPNVVQKGVRNFFNNLQDMWSTVNTALQGKKQETGDNLGRVMVNSTIGLLGILDPASQLQIDRHTTTLGATLGVWGVKPGPYVVLPVLGPSTVRETAVLVVDLKADPVNNIVDPATRDTLVILEAIDKRTFLLGAGNVLDQAALDKYSFLRDAYLARQRNYDYDGNPPDDTEDPSKP